MALHTYRPACVGNTGEVSSSIEVPTEVTTVALATPSTVHVNATLPGFGVTAHTKPYGTGV